MERSFASYLTGDVEASRKELEMGIIGIYCILTFLPLITLLGSCLLLWITKLSYFKDAINCCLTFFTYGIIEQIFISAIKYVHTTKGDVFPNQIPRDESVHRINNKIYTKTTAKRIKRSAAFLFPFQTYILTLVIIDQLFMRDNSIATCETYQQILDSSVFHATECFVKPKSVPNIPAGEYLNPVNAFRSIPHVQTINLTSYCQNSSTLQNETVFTDYHIQCTKHFFRWNNIINTLTNAIQWHEITVFIIRTSLYCTFSWQHGLGHSHWWLKTSKIYRLIILSSLTIIWTTIFVVYVLIIVAFNKTLASAQVTLTFQTSAVLLIPMFVIPLLFYNTLTLSHWIIRTIRGRKCEQEVSLTFDTYRNVSIYAEHNKNKQKEIDDVSNPYLI